jgi:chitin disaccharide deacetylase
MLPPPKGLRPNEGRRAVRVKTLRQMVANAPKRIWLCADDYGISPKVNGAIRDLIARGRLNATSVMVAGPAIGRDQADALAAAAASSQRCAIGLHVTLTAPFRPLTMHFKPTDGGMFLQFAKLLRLGLMGRLDAEVIRTELTVQLSSFGELFGRAPDFVDGHQHVQLFPVVRDAFLAAVKEAAPGAWVRQCGRNRPLLERFGSAKGLVLDVLSAGFRRRASSSNIAFNPDFAGAYDFSSKPDFAALMQQFLQGVSEGAVLMCHPGEVDDVLVSLDPLTEQREREYAFLASERFPRLLAANGIALS